MNGFPFRCCENNRKAPIHKSSRFVIGTARTANRVSTKTGKSKIIDRYLITTADERSWKFDRPVLFLGEWCRLYDRKHVWEGMDAIVAEPYGLQAGRKRQDLAYIQALTRELLREVADALNRYHKTRCSIRYWNIVIGHWLQRYVNVAFNRYFTLEQTLKNHGISGTTVFYSTDYGLRTADSLSFIWACNDDVWNHVFYAKILNFLGMIKTEVDSTPLQGERGFAQKKNHGVQREKSFKHFVFSAARHVLPMFRRENDAFIINSYLPLIEEAKLQLSFGQCPQLWKSPVLENFSLPPRDRDEFILDAKSHAGFERFVRNQLGEVIPSCYLEGYDQLVRQVESLPWPTAPKFIFTSNNFDTDEIFKIWCGMKVEEGIPYFTGQHGNNYGTHFYYGNSCWPERSESNHFLTWGWSDGSPNVVPAFNFKTVSPSPKPGRYDPKGGLLLVETCTPHRITSWDSYFEFGLYQEEQFRFVEALPEPIQKELTVRLHQEYRRNRWSDEQRWKDRSPNTKIDAGATSIRELIAKSRWVVQSYDSTGLLENLALNIPSLCFWNGGFDQLLQDAVPYYELLRKAGILVDTPEQAAEKVSLWWDRVDEWWESQPVQGAREAFCRQYARTEKHPVRKMRRLLNACVCNQRSG